MEHFTDCVDVWHGLLSRASGLSYPKDSRQEQLLSAMLEA
jgi:hypothetical protein